MVPLKSDFLASRIIYFIRMISYKYLYVPGIGTLGVRALSSIHILQIIELIAKIFIMDTLVTIFNYGYVSIAKIA